MATVKKKRAPETRRPGPGELRVSLYDQGMTPMLRAGLGGLAAALRYHGAELAARAPGSSASVDRTSVTLRWERGAEDLVRALFELTFQLAHVRRDSRGMDAGMIYVPSSWGELARGGVEARLVMNALGSAVMGTTLQHTSCWSRSKDSGVPQTVSVDEVERQVFFNLVHSYTHTRAETREKITGLLDGKPGETISMAGWAQPGGGVQYRWDGDSDVRYDAGQALCACFVLAGTLPFRSRVAGSNCVLAVPVPTNLLDYAEVLRDLIPRSVTECVVSGTEDASMLVWARLRQARRRDCVGEVHAVSFGDTASIASQQARRAAYVVREPDPDLVRACGTAQVAFANTRVFHQKSGLLVFPNHVRGTVTKNLVRGRPWFLGWHATRDHEFKQILINQHLRRGLYEMSKEHLTEQQRDFVEAVHACLDKRFATLPKMYVGPQAYKKFDSIKDGFRLKLRAAKTHAVSRSILASFFSEGGGNAFTSRGSTVTALVMRARDWEEVRDLALLALATYGEGKERKPKDGTPPTNPDAESPGEGALNALREAIQGMTPNETTDDSDTVGN